MDIAIVGSTGAVGKELVRLIKERKLPHDNLYLFSSKDTPDFSGIDLVFFCVSAELAKEMIPAAREKGATCIDASSAFRKDPSVPLVVPEINRAALENHQGIVASPNCTTTLMLLPLAPLHREFGVRRIVAATYQAVSGAGGKAIGELKEQTLSALEGRPTTPEVFPYPSAFNVFPHESPLLDGGGVEEEEKMVLETKKILGEEIEVSATCVRVPVFRSHSIALNVECEKKFTLEELSSLVGKAEGVTLCQGAPPTALDRAGENEVLCGRVRLDPTRPHAASLWVVGDQLLKGAALNMIQIAEALSD